MHNARSAALMSSLPWLLAGAGRHDLGAGQAAPVRVKQVQESGGNTSTRVQGLPRYSAVLWCDSCQACYSQTGPACKVEQDSSQALQLALR
jgi:hypothetical protein